MKCIIVCLRCSHLGCTFQVTTCDAIYISSDYISSDYIVRQTKRHLLWHLPRWTTITFSSTLINKLHLEHNKQYWYRKPHGSVGWFLYGSSILEDLEFVVLGFFFGGWRVEKRRTQRKTLGARRETGTNSNRVWHRVRESNPHHLGGRYSPLLPCFWISPCNMYPLWYNSTQSSVPNLQHCPCLLAPL